ncbi:MAG: sodium/proton antiporter [Planctomycetes bacterium]|nr:sodium/proton antiporter [Planctomycetota bacterium]
MVVDVAEDRLVANGSRDGTALTIVLPAGLPTVSAIADADAANTHAVRLLAVHDDVTISGGIRTARFIVGWILLAEFIFTLAMALSCYPLLPGGLLALQALLLGLCSVDHLYQEAHHNFPVILLLVFVVAGVNFLKEWLSVVFTALLFSTRSKIVLSLLFCIAGALLSAFLDALTVTAVIIAVAKGFWDVYHAYRSRTGDHDDAELEQFRAFLRSLVMHAVIGTALGGVTTLVGEPQNLLIAHLVAENVPDGHERWSFLGFFLRMAMVTLPTLVAGLLTVVVCERFKLMGYGQPMPERVRTALAEHAATVAAQRTPLDRARLRVQGALALLLVVGLAFHLAEVGILGLFLIVLATAFTGVNDEHRIGHAFTESLPFTTLLMVFFAIVAMIAEQDLFRPIITLALAQEAHGQLVAFYWANAVLSAVSDNVFVATVFINEATAALHAGTIDAPQYEKLAVAINCGTNLPSVATPNGQAALLFLLTSAIAAPIRLGYVTMLKMALPYTIVLTAVSFTAMYLWL